MTISDTPGEGLVERITQVLAALNDDKHPTCDWLEIKACLREAIAALSRAPEAVPIDLIDAALDAAGRPHTHEYTERMRVALANAPAKPALALIEELERALKRIVFDWDGEPGDMDEARTALASAKRFKGGGK